MSNIKIFDGQDSNDECENDLNAKMFEFDIRMMTIDIRMMTFKCQTSSNEHQTNISAMPEKEEAVTIFL